MQAPPRLRTNEEVTIEPVSPALVSTAISSQDGPQPPAGEGQPGEA